jgi:hypothetical protein
MTKVKYLREQTKGSKHVTFDPSGRYATVSCTDGLLYVYSLVSDDPELVRKLNGSITGTPRYLSMFPYRLHSLDHVVTVYD